MDRSVAGESKWNSKRRRLVLRVFNSTTDRHQDTLDSAAGLSRPNAASASDPWGPSNFDARSDNDGQSESFIGRLATDADEIIPLDRSQLTEQPTTATTFGNRQPQKRTLQHVRIDGNRWSSDRRGNDGILNGSHLPRLNSSGNRGHEKVGLSSKSYHLPTERDAQVGLGLIRSNSDSRKGTHKRNSLPPDNYWTSGRIFGYLDNFELISTRNQEKNQTDRPTGRRKVIGLQFDPPLYLPILNGLDLGPSRVAIDIDEGQPPYYYVPDRFGSRDISRDLSRDRTKTMNSFPPATPEDLKFLSAKHFLRKLRREKQEADLNRKYGADPEEGGGTGTGVLPEVESKVHDDRSDTASTGSTGSTATVYLIRRTIKKSSLGPNGGNHHDNGKNHHGNGKANDLELSTPYKRRNVGNLRREIVLEPVQIARNTREGQAKDTGEGQAKDTGEGQQSRTAKTKRVKDSTAQTSDLYSTERDAEVSSAAVVPVKVIVPRRPKRTIGLQTTDQAELFDDATVTSSSSSNPRSRRSIGMQTTPIISLTTSGTQTTGGDDVITRRHQRRTRDFGAQTDADSNPLPEIEEAEERVTSRERHKRTSNVRDAHDDLSKANDATTNTRIADVPQDSLQEQTTCLTESQNMTFYSLQHEVRLLRHENYFLRQQLDYPIKPKGKLQKQNEEKILQMILRLESKGSKGKMTPQIRDEMIHETMIENEILRSENSGLQATLDQSQRLQERLTSENDVLKKKLDLLQQPADSTERQLYAVAMGVDP